MSILILGGGVGGRPRRDAPPVILPPPPPPPPGPSSWTPDDTADQQAVQALFATLSLDELFVHTTGTDADGITGTDQAGTSVTNGDPVGWWPDHRDVDRGLTAKNDTLRAEWNAAEDAVEFKAPSGPTGRSLFFPSELSSPTFYLSMALKSTLDNTNDQIVLVTPRWQVQAVVAGSKEMVIRTSGQWWQIIDGFVGDWRLIEVRSNGEWLDWRANGTAWQRATPNTWLSNTSASPEGDPDPRVSQIGRGRFNAGDGDFLHWEGLVNGLVITQGGDLPSDVQAEPIRRLVTRGLGLTGLNPEATAPVANDDTASTPFETAVEIDVLANDTAPGSSLDPASVAVVTQGAKGTAAPNPSGTITYTPSAGQDGADSFTYTVDNVAEVTSNVATVAVTIGADGGGTPSGEPGATTPATTTVSSHGALATAINGASAGTVIVLNNANYGGSKLTVSASGTQSNPIVIRAANILGAVMPQGINVTGSWVILRGIDFSEDATGTDRVTVSGNDSQVWRCRFRYNGGQNNLRLLDCNRPRVMYCDFTVWRQDNFAPSSRSLGAWIGGNNPVYDADIGFCYFYNLLSKPDGQSYGFRARSALGLNNANNNSLLNSNWRVHHCLFVNCGNSRLNVKMSGNLVEYCTITGKNGGSLTYSTDFNQRFGQNNTWRGCWSENADGYRVQGKGHKYISCKSVNSTALDVAVGDHDPPPALSGNPRADQVKLTACELTIRVGGMGWAGNLPARNTRIENHQGSVSLVSGNHTGTVQVGTMSETPVTPRKMLVSEVGVNGNGVE